MYFYMHSYADKNFILVKSECYMTVGTPGGGDGCPRQHHDGNRSGHTERVIVMWACEAMGGRRLRG
jgi:hypothetical protein